MSNLKTLNDLLLQIQLVFEHITHDFRSRAKEDVPESLCKCFENTGSYGKI